MPSIVMVETPPLLSKMRPATQFKREFKAFLAGIGFQLKHFLPDDNVGEKMFPEYLIARATGYEKLRGEGSLTESLALQWAKRSEQFLQEAVKSGHTVSLDGISFIDYEGCRPKVNWQKLISLYEVEKLVPISLKIDESIDDVKVEKILQAIHALVGDIKMSVLKAREGCTEVTILIPRQKAEEIISLFPTLTDPGTVLKVEEATMPPKGSLARTLLLEGPVIDLATLDSLAQFAQVWRKATRIESAIRPWRRLRCLTALSIASSPLARVISDSNDRAYAADFRGKERAFKADVKMACITWPLCAATLLALVLSVLHLFSPNIAVVAGVATGLALSLAGAQVCSSALSPVACGAGTVVMCWAFGLAQAFSIGLIGSVRSLSRASIQQDFFISITGGIVGLSAPDWRTQMPLSLEILLLLAIASAIALAGWFMTQPARAAAVVPRVSALRLVLGSAAGAAVGAAIMLVGLISKAFVHWGCPPHIAFMAAFAMIGSATFVFTIYLRMPQVRREKLARFAVMHTVVSCTLCGLAYQNAGQGLGLLALAASNGLYHATWFTAASVVGNRIGSVRAAVIATTLEGALGFSAFLMFILLRG